VLNFAPDVLSIKIGATTCDTTCDGKNCSCNLVKYPVSAKTLMTRTCWLAFSVLTLVYTVGCTDSETQKRDRARGHRYGYHSETTEIRDSTMVPPPTETVETTTTTTAPPDTTVSHTEVKSTATTGTSQPKKDYPYGTPVPGKAGFVTSPHAPYSGYVDVRGYPPGTEVKDPYTGKTFLVP
jgi:hypothetical protein